jgi:galactose mutarotase-like enzyme
MSEKQPEGDGGGQRLVLENEAMRLEVLPELGGKIASMTLGHGAAATGGTLLQGPLRPYEPRTPTIPFDHADGSGWDECLPSIGPCTVAYGDGKTARIEDHGDVWRLRWTVDEAEATRLRMHVACTSLPLEFERTLRLEGATLHVDYSVRNTGDAPAPYGWSIHPLFAIQPFDRILLPPSITKVRAEASANGRLGRAGSEHPWPMTVNSNDGEPLDLSIAGSHDDGVGDKLVLPTPAEGWCALERKTLRTRLTMHFDPKALPWLGLWICYGGWPEGGSGGKGYTVAIEPCTLPVDSLEASLTQGGGATLAAGEQKQWTVRIELSHAEER